MPRANDPPPLSGASDEADSGRFAYDGLDRVIHEKARLGLMTSLAANPSGVTFVELKALCGLTDGNLNRHLKVLSEAAMVEVSKSGAGRNQQSLVCLTAEGREEFNRYIAVLEQVLRDAQGAVVSTPRKAGRAGLSSA